MTIIASPETGRTLADMMPCGELFSKECPSRDVLKHVTSRWGVLVLVALMDGGTMRFSDLRRKIGGVSEKMLSRFGRGVPLAGGLVGGGIDGFMMKKIADQAMKEFPAVRP